MAHEVVLDFDAILDVALKGVRRCSVFLGFGVNAARDEKQNDFHITSDINVLPLDLSVDTISHFKSEFEAWVVANGIRELVETFSVFLDRIHHACLLIKNHRNNPPAFLDEEQKSFEQQGFPNKLNMLSQKHNVSPKHANFLRSINRLRACLTHRRGFVGIADINKDNTLLVGWLGFDLYIEEPNGAQHHFPDIIGNQINLVEGGTVMCRFVERERGFPLGTIVKLSPRDVNEICCFFTEEAKRTCESALCYAKSMGIAVRDTHAPSSSCEPKAE